MGASSGVDMHRYILVFLLCSCAPVIPMHECARDFRDQWWMIDPDVTDSMDIQRICFNVGSDGYLEITNYIGDFHRLVEWECVESTDASVDSYRVNGQGKVEVSKYGDFWWLDLRMWTFVKAQGEVWPCEDFMGEYFYGDI